ncbi:MAG: response regulator [Streptococcus gallolyticus]|nr:response regulator [Streptococcus gallolyticus]
MAKYEIRVKDNGIGMSKEFVKKLFEPFSREQKAVKSKIQGTGLGMAITKELVDLMKGTIKVDSKPGAGTEFTITFDFMVAQIDETYSNSANSEEERLNHLKGIKILVVDDNEMNLEIAEMILHETGAIVETLNNGGEAVERIRTSEVGRYDVILMDVQMPELNGHEATKLIRGLEDPRRANIPIIALSANALQEDVIESKNVGMDNHIAKPFNVKQLIKMIHNVLSSRKEGHA